MDGEVSRTSASAVTTVVVRSALAGDRGALERMIQRFSPPLLVQARYRMHEWLRQFCDPEDVVADAWQRALPRLTADLLSPDRRCTPRVVKFLSQIIVHRVNELVRERMRREGPTVRANEPLPAGELPGVLPLANGGRSTLRSIIEHEDVINVLRMLSDLSSQDREVIVLRKVEGHTSHEVSERLGVSVNAVDTRLSRALAYLRKRLPENIFDELLEGDR